MFFTNDYLKATSINYVFIITGLKYLSGKKSKYKKKRRTKLSAPQNN